MGFPGISIPAPARGRTYVVFHVPRAQTISIPAPARGRTAAVLGRLGVLDYFNSRPREGANWWCLLG